MKVIIDTNIAFSAILNPKSNISDVVLNSQDFFQFFSCQYLKEEILNHKDKILKISKYSETDFQETKEILYENISFFDESLIPFEFWKDASVLIRGVDSDDISFVALSLFLDIKIWTGDKILIEGLRKKGFVNFITTQ